VSAAGSKIQRYVGRTWAGGAFGLPIDHGLGYRPAQQTDQRGLTGDPDELLTAAETAELCGLSVGEIRKRCRSGMLAHRHLAGRYYLPRRVAERLAGER
jgi:hypothetical protein